MIVKYSFTNERILNSIWKIVYKDRPIFLEANRLWRICYSNPLDLLCITSTPTPKSYLNPKPN